MKLNLILISILSIAGCSMNKKPTEDVFCSELRNFVDQKTCDNHKSVVLKTCFWCGDSIFWRQCDSFDFEPGQKLCSYLLVNARTEFPQDNLKRALQCFANDNFKPVQNAMEVLNDVEYHFIDVEGVKNDVIVSLYYQENTEDGLPTLKIETGSMCDE